MYVGLLKITLKLHDCRSLKAKRGPRRRLIERGRNRFRVAISEVDDQDTWNVLTLGVAAVGPDFVPVERVINQVADWIADSNEGVVIDEQREIEKA